MTKTIASLAHIHAQMGELKNSDPERFSQSAETSTVLL